MNTFIQKSENGAITISKDKGDYRTLYDIDYDVNCLLTNTQERFQMFGITFKSMCTIYQNWCKTVGAKWIDVGSLFEPHRINEPWKDLDRISIDDEEIIP